MPRKRRGAPKGWTLASDGRWEKECTRKGCVYLMRERYFYRLKDRRFCAIRCTNLANREVRRRAQLHAAIRRDVCTVQRALGLKGKPSVGLVRAVRIVRNRAYDAGYKLVAHKVQRAISRGVLVRTNQEHTRE